ncbi:MAG: hypothetical protein FJ399_05925, partial [Verrucomicrobia bacterium]|nr:hypothetical protein [Verrucomicrobiota bacterium]
AIQLSPFEVQADKDVGYQAGNTTSGSRLNARLKDTPASISSFTKEFLSDIAATNLEEMLGFAANMEPEVSDTIDSGPNSFSAPGARQATGTDFGFRLRGLAGTASVDYMESAVPIDLYNVDRAEVSSGPNAVLFGLGAAGGTVALTGVRANLRRDRTTLKAVFGSWAYARFEAGFNKVLLRDQLALRVVGLHQNSAHWRKYQFNDQKRGTVAATWRPFKSTTLSASYEKGRIDNAAVINLNALDGLSAWNLAGRPVVDGNPVPGTARITTQYYTHVNNDGVITSFRNELASVTSLPAGVTPTLVPSAQMPFDVNLGGPGGRRWQRFDSLKVNLEQRLTKELQVELAYGRNQNDAYAQFPHAALIALQGDPNLTLPAPDGSAATVPNPHKGQLFLDSFWSRDTFAVTNDVVRATGAWSVDLGRWFGRHRLAGLLERSAQDRARGIQAQVLVDQHNVPINSATLPEGDSNRLMQRRYLTEGGFEGYYAGNLDAPLPAFSLPGRTFTTRWVNHTISTVDHGLKDIDTAMVAGHSAWWQDRLIATLGYRIDEIELNNAEKGRVTNPNDPRIQSGQVLLNENAVSDVFRTNRYRAKTFSAGAVAHLHARLSLFGNFSRNAGAPNFGTVVLPKGETGPPTDGEGSDFGVMLDFLGDDRFFARLTRFQTQMLRHVSFTPASNTMGRDNHQNLLNVLLAAGRITPAQFDAQNINYNAMMADYDTTGYEVEFVANPTRNFTLRLAGSKSTTRRANIGQEIVDFMEPKYPEWRRLAAGNAALLATVENEIAQIDSEVAAQRLRNSAANGARPWKGNLSGRYRFDAGRLKGGFVGGAVRYSGPVLINFDAATGREYFGNKQVFGDVFAGYRVRLPWHKLPLTLQLNVRNVTNSYNVVVARLNSNYAGPARVYLNDPRNYRLTVSTEF